VFARRPYFFAGVDHDRALSLFELNLTLANS
jgi:hypothetical protein